MADTMCPQPSGFRGCSSIVTIINNIIIIIIIIVIISSSSSSSSIVICLFHPPLEEALRHVFRSAQVRAYDDRAQFRNIGIPYIKSLCPVVVCALTYVALMFAPRWAAAIGLESQFAAGGVHTEVRIASIARHNFSVPPTKA